MDSKKQFEQPQMEDYRDNLADDLKEIRKDTPDKARVVLEAHKTTSKYKESENSHRDSRGFPKSMFREKSVRGDYGYPTPEELKQLGVVEVGYRKNSNYGDIKYYVCSDGSAEIRSQLNDLQNDATRFERIHEWEISSGRMKRSKNGQEWIEKVPAGKWEIQFIYSTNNSVGDYQGRHIMPYGLDDR